MLKYQLHCRLVGHRQQTQIAGEFFTRIWFLENRSGIALPNRRLYPKFQHLPCCHQDGKRNSTLFPGSRIGET